MVKVIDHPLIIERLNLMRQKETPPELFRNLLREIAIFLCYEAARDLDTYRIEIETPLAKMQTRALKTPSPVLVSILRAGSGFLDGALTVFPKARVGFLGMYRDEATLQPVDYYKNLPTDLHSSPIFVLDPMLATGNSALAAIDRLVEEGARDIRLITLLAAPEGIQLLREKHKDLEIYTSAIDKKLNRKGFIVPGLGDAGDRIYNSL